MAASLALWAGGTFAHHLVTKRVVRALPPEWRDHPEAGPDYAAVLGWGPRDYVAPVLRFAPWLAGIAAYVIFLSLLGVSRGVQVGACALGSLLWAQGIRASDRARARAFAEREGLAYPKRPLARRLAYEGTLYLACLGSVLTGCFAGLVVWSLVG